MDLKLQLHSNTENQILYFKILYTLAFVKSIGSIQQIA